MNAPAASKLDAIVLDPTAGPADASVIWLHGLGADGNDFAPIVSELGLPRDHRIRFLFPHAPKMAVTVNNGMVMRAWFDIATPAIEQQPDVAGIEASAQAVQQLIDDQVAAGIDHRRIVLAGFSQGGVVTLHQGLRQPVPLAGLVVLSSYLALPVTTSTVAAPPIFMGHGIADPVIPLQLAEKSRDQLVAAGHAVEWHDYPMPHSVNVEEIAAISAFLQRCLAN